MRDNEENNNPPAIAIVGLAGRFPGADDIGSFWRNLRDGVESIRTLSDAELLEAGVTADMLARGDYVRAAAPLRQIDQFAGEFFGFSPKEAQITDPQHRIFLECAWEALEDAGCVPSRYPGRIGVYAGTGLNTYLLKCLLPYSAQLADGIGVLSLVIGNKTDFMTTQVSYKLNLRGPSISINTACSTSLVATHMACQSLLAYECDMALAGGVSVHVPHFGGYVHQPGGVFSPDGHCRPFDAAAQGTVPGNGAGIAVLKRLEDAVADGDHIYAVIRGTCVNNDGAQKVGFTAPSAEGQRDAIATALAVAGVAPSSIGYVEAHGTATTLGDPLELKALAQAFAGEQAATRCAVGSVKGNIGHLDAAAGIAGLIKTVLCLKHRELVPSINYSRPNPQLGLAQTPFHVNTERREWQPNEGSAQLRAGVSSFGIGGTNAHVVLESWSQAATPASARPWQLLPLSARTGGELEAAGVRLADHFETSADLALADVGFTLQVGRTPFAQRRALLARDGSAAAAHLRGRDPLYTLAGVARDPAPSVTFLFPGMGEQYVGMARGLYASEPVFKAAFDECADLLQRSHGLDLRGGLFPAAADRAAADADAPGGRIDLRAMLGRGAAATAESAQATDRTAFAHPALFAIGWSLARTWMAWGIAPTAMIGHSLGEYVAACVAGVMSLEDALRIVAERARLIEALPQGAMLAVAAASDALAPLLRDGVGIAAANADGLSVLSGPAPALAALQAELAARGWAWRPVNSAHAFHSTMMAPVCAPLVDLFRGVRLQPPQIPYLSNLTGDWITPAQATDPDYWAQHTCSTVRFGDGVARLLADPARLFLEVGPGQSLASFVFQGAAPARRESLAVHASLPGALEQADDSFVFTRTLAALWCAGVEIDWAAYHAGSERRRVPLPTYAFARQRYWFDAPAGAVPLAPAAFAASSLPAATVVADAAAATTDAGTPRDVVAPEGDIEIAVAALWSAILGIATIGRDDHFFRLGGSSLLAVQLMGRVRAAFELEVTVRALFEQPTLAAFSAHIEDLLLSEIEALGDGAVATQVATEAAIARPYQLPNGMQVMQFNAVETDHFYHDIFETEVYARNGVSIPKNAVIFDVGANIGLFSLFAHSRAPCAQIYAFEPAPPVFDALRRNTENAGANVRLFNAGLSDRAGRQALTFYPNSTGMSSFHADKDEEKAVLRAIIENQLEPAGAAAGELRGEMEDILDYRFREQAFECEMRTMSDVIRECGVTRVDLLKIDVQKCEYEVIQGIEDEHWPQIRQVVIEVHDLDGRVAQVSSLLEARGFHVAVEQDALYRGSTISNLYAIRH